MKLQRNVFMANLSEIKRDKMIAFLEELKKQHNDDESIRAFNEIENSLRDKKYGLVWEEHSEEVDELLKENIPVLCSDPERRLCKDENLPWNFIIEGDNLQALYLLQKTHKGKIDCIYIDPPYNTGARDWKYNNDYVDGNDRYRHSKWLSMMKARLHLAKDLFNPDDSVLICTIDEKEYLHLGCLLEEMFPDMRMQMISSLINITGVANDRFGRTDEYIFIIYIGKATPAKLPLDNDWIESFGKTTRNELHWNGLMRTGSGALKADSPGCFYPIYVSLDGKRIVEIGDPYPIDKDIKDAPEKPNCKIIWPIHLDGKEGRWRVSPTVLKKYLANGFVKMGNFTDRGMAINYLAQGEQKKVFDGEFSIIGHDENGAIIVNDSKYIAKFVPGSQWRIRTHDATRHGTGLINKILGTKVFNFPKSVYAVHDVIRFFISNKPNSTVLDFFAGSGTTQHAVNLLNAEDGGKRRCIMVTNNEVSEKEAKELSAKGFKPGDKEWEEKGIAKYVTWPRTVCSIEGQDINGKKLSGNYLTKDENGKEIPMSKGFQVNVKYYKCEWTPRKPEDYLLSNALCLHIKEMIELQNAIEVDNIKNVLILNKTDFKNTIMNPEILPKIEKVWVNQNIVFSADELKTLTAKGFKYIPKEFFGQELKEAAE